jgi:hypothetical protein
LVLAIGCFALQVCFVLFSEKQYVFPHVAPDLFEAAEAKNRSAAAEKKGRGYCFLIFSLMKL